MQSACPRSSSALCSWGSQAPAQAAADPARPEVWLGDELAVSYAARIEREWLVVEARHEPGWHTYATDNVHRAREVTGKGRPDTELPTRITPSSELEVAPPWRQTEPTRSTTSADPTRSPSSMTTSTTRCAAPSATTRNWTWWSPRRTASWPPAASPGPMT